MISEPIEFWSDIECSGVRSLHTVRSRQEQYTVVVSRGHSHWCAVVRAQKAYAFFSDFGQLEEGDHLKAVILHE